MRKRAVVIKYGDPEMGNALADGIMKALPVAEPLNESEIKVVQSEINKKSVERHLLRVAVGNFKSTEDYNCMVAKAQGDHGYIRPHGLLYDAFWGAVGCIVLAISGGYRRLQARNREA